MNIAFVGYAGSGKTTIAKEFSKLHPEFTYINIDEEVNKLYEKEGIKDWIIKYFGPYSYSYIYGKFYVHKEFLLNAIIKNKDLYYRLMLLTTHLLRDTLDFSKNYIFDGIQAYKYQKELNIDKIIYVSCDKKVRRERLLKKDWSNNKIRKIEKLQKEYKFKKYNFELKNDGYYPLSTFYNLLSLFHKHGWI